MYGVIVFVGVCGLVDGVVFFVGGGCECGDVCGVVVLCVVGMCVV